VACVTGSLRETEHNAWLSSARGHEIPRSEYFFGARYHY